MSMNERRFKTVGCLCAICDGNSLATWSTQKTDSNGSSMEGLEKVYTCRRKTIKRTVCKNHITQSKIRDQDRDQASEDIDDPESDGGGEVWRHWN